MATTGNKFDTSYGHTDGKEHQNIMALTGEGFIKGTFTYSGTIDLAELDELEGATNAVTVPGVALGDMVIGVSCSVDVVDLIVTGYVQAADLVEVRVDNLAASSVDLASATWRIVVLDLT